MARGSIIKRPSGNHAIVYYVNGKQKWFAHRDPARVQTGRTRLAPSTFAEYRRAVLAHVSPRLGARTLASLRTEDVDAFIAALEAEGKTPGTVRNILTPLRKMLADAVRQGKLLANPAARADLPPAQDFTGKEIPREHTDAIRAALVDLAPRDPLRSEPDLFFACFFDVALGTGLRLGELRALRWCDVDRERRLIHVERAYSRRELKRPKTESGVRSVPLFGSVDEALRHLAARAVERGRYAPDELVFATIHGTPLHESNFNRRVWHPALERAGLREAGYRFHDLRHTVCFAAGRRRRRRQARPGGGRAFESAHHAQALLAPPRRPRQRGRGALRSGARSLAVP